MFQLYRRYAHVAELIFHAGVHHCTQHGPQPPSTTALGVLTPPHKPTPNPLISTSTRLVDLSLMITTTTPLDQSLLSGPPSDRLQENSRFSADDIERFNCECLADKWTSFCPLFFFTRYLHVAQYNTIGVHNNRGFVESFENFTLYYTALIKQNNNVTINV